MEAPAQAGSGTGQPRSPQGGYLEVEVSDVEGVHVGQAQQDLLQELDGFVLRQQLLFRNEVEEFASQDAVEKRGVRGS